MGSDRFHGKVRKGAWLWHGELVDDKDHGRTHTLRFMAFSEEGVVKKMNARITRVLDYEMRARKEWKVL